MDCTKRGGSQIWSEAINPELAAESKGFSTTVDVMCRKKEMSDVLLHSLSYA
jgi:hypothetical protein